MGFWEMLISKTQIYYCWELIELVMFHIYFKRNIIPIYTLEITPKLLKIMGQLVRIFVSDVNHFLSYLRLPSLTSEIGFGEVRGDAEKTAIRK
jgi:hypothetical protein